MEARDALVRHAERGLHCPAGDFYIDPWRPVERALITHAHADHARHGSRHYLGAAPGVPLLQRRLGGDARIEAIAYGERRRIGEVDVSFHPAGHVLGSAQIRLAHRGEVWVVSGDYKRDADPTCAPFEVQRCDTFITEATFSLPIYVWPSGEQVAREILAWWDQNRALDRPSVLFCYALGKSQRVLAELARLCERTVLVHGAVAPLTRLYRQAGVAMLPVEQVDLRSRREYGGELIIAPPGAAGTPWMRRFRNASTGFCSGWMRLRGQRRRRAYDRGFVLSDHADWPGLLRTIEETGAARVLATHGQSDTLVRYLRERGQYADTLETQFAGEEGAAGEGEAEALPGAASERTGSA
jgi:putative mRNA 3-end processing factor